VLRVFGVTNRRPPEVARDFQATGGLADQFVREIFLSTPNLPQFLLSSFLIVKEVLVDPAHDESRAETLQDFQPWTRSIATITDKGEQRPPGAHQQARHFLLFLAEFFCLFPFGGSPPHARQLGNAFQSRNDRSCPCHCHHPDGSERWHVKEQSHAGAVQSFGFAGKHRPGGLQGASFGLLDHAAIKEAKNSLPLPFEPLHLFLGFFQ